MSAILAALLAQGPAAYDIQFQRESAARAMWAACLFRENDHRRAIGRTDLTDFGTGCVAERQEVVRLYHEAARSTDVIAAGLEGYEDTFRESIAQMNEYYPASLGNKRSKER